MPSCLWAGCDPFKLTEVFKTLTLSQSGHWNVCFNQRSVWGCKFSWRNPEHFTNLIKADLEKSGFIVPSN